MFGSITSRMYLSVMMPPCGRMPSATSPATRAIASPTTARKIFGRGYSSGPGLKFGVISVYLYDLPRNSGFVPFCQLSHTAFIIWMYSFIRGAGALQVPPKRRSL